VCDCDNDNHCFLRLLHCVLENLRNWNDFPKIITKVAQNCYIFASLPRLTFNKEAKMKSYRKELWMEIPTRRAFINITDEVQQCIDESGVQEGLVLCNAMHITASVFINDDESGLHHDYDIWLEKLAPHAPVSQYRHNVGEDNADAHMKRQIMGREVVVAISGGRLDFGTWEQIFYGEFDGRRKKRVLIKIIGE
jgi:secondary thiamine-phosphate synthase enzyme